MLDFSTPRTATALWVLFGTAPQRLELLRSPFGIFSESLQSRFALLAPTFSSRVQRKTGLLRRQLGVPFDAILLNNQLSDYLCMTRFD